METTILTRRSATAALLLTAVILVISVQASPAAAGGSRHTDYSYSWPVKPFDQPHPVRGGFGDPRTVFAGPPTQRTLNTGGGSFQFHDGIDISASDGTAVYPVESGTVAVVVQTAHEQYVAVACADGRSFEYWHIAASVSVGAHVDAHVSVPTHVVYDVRDRLPALGDFWRVYARGTHQNMSVFGRHYSFMQPGVYLFRLAPGGFDTRRLPDCVYDLVVTATDIRGNRI